VSIANPSVQGRKGLSGLELSFISDRSEDKIPIAWPRLRRCRQRSFAISTLIKNATVVTGGQSLQTSVLIANGKIVDLDPASTITAAQTVDAEGLVLLPGIIDDQVHFREPGLTDKEDLAHASRACAKGGVTSYLEMPNTIPNAVTQDRIDEKLAIAAKSSLVNFGFYIGATPNNVNDLKHAVRTPGIKIFIGSSTGDLLVDSQDALETIFAETTLPICAHCEDEATVKRNAEKYSGRTDVATHSLVRDHEAALIATARAIDLSHRHQHRFHVLHVSTAGEVELIRKAKQQHNFVTAEACPHHLFFSVDDYERLGSLVKMNPSIKTKEDNVALFAGLLDGTIDVVATDHAPHLMAEKQLPYPQCPSGLPAVENYLALMLNEVNRGRCSLVQIAAWMSEAPAKVWNMKRKGKIEVGYDADLVLVDMHLERQIRNEDQQTKCRWSPWAGETLKGWPVKTWVMGEEVFRLDGGVESFGQSRGSAIEYETSGD
jgi:dihydroorotase